MPHNIAIAQCTCRTGSEFKAFVEFRVRCQYEEFGMDDCMNPLRSLYASDFLSIVEYLQNTHSCKYSSCSRFITRAARGFARRIEEDRNLWSRKVSHYCSEQGLKDKVFQDQRNSTILSKRFISINGQAVSLLDIADNAAMNLTWETVHKIGSMADLMIANNWIASFHVVTMPSVYHRNSVNWNGCTPRMTHDDANVIWRKIRARMSKAGYEEGVDWQCCRTVEPHKDATPHYNLCAVGSTTTLRFFSRLVFLMCLHEFYPDEKGALKNRVKVSEGEGSLQILIVIVPILLLRLVKEPAIPCPSGRVAALPWIA